MSTRWQAWLLGVLIFGCYALPQPYFETLNNPNENVRVYMTRAMVDHGTMSIDPIVAEWGYVNDKAVFEGRLYAGKAPGSSYLAVPGYWVYRTLCEVRDRPVTRRGSVLACRWSCSLLPCLLFLLAFGRWVARRSADPRDGLLAVTLLALGSTFFPYSMLAASHSTIAACCFGGWMLGADHLDAPSDPWRPLGTGFLFASAVCMEYPAVLAAGVVWLYCLFRSPRPGRWAFWTVTGGLLPIAALVLYHMEFGGPLETPYGHLENPDFARSHSAGFFGMDDLATEALAGSLVTPSNGLFWYMPWTAAALLAAFHGAAHRDLRAGALLTLAVTAIYIVFVSMVDNWRGGWTAGPRYIMPIIPFLAWWWVRWLAWARTQPGVSAAAGWVGPALLLPAVLACSVSAMLFPHYPEQVRNPIVELGLWLPMQGLVPQGPWRSHVQGGMLGWLVLMLPGAGLVAGAWWASPRGRLSMRLPALVGGLALGMALLQPMTRPTTRNARQLQAVREMVVRMWPRQGPRPEEAIRTLAHPWQVRDHDLTAQRLRALAAEAASMGWPVSAWVLRARAWDSVPLDVALLPCPARGAQPPGDGLDLEGWPSDAD
jgi:hypothetical protein